MASGFPTPQELWDCTFAEENAWRDRFAAITYLDKGSNWQIRFYQDIGELLDFGGGIGSHALAAAALPKVKRVWYVDLNPHNRAFVEWRAQQLGLAANLATGRDLDDPRLPTRFDTIVCLDVLEHLPDPAGQLEIFATRLKEQQGTALMNWYFFQGFKGEYPFHFDDPQLVESFFLTLQRHFLEVFHPWLITTRAYRLMPKDL